MTREKAVKIIKEFISGTCLHLVDQEALETLIPELKENEDEKIRKEIRDFILYNAGKDITEETEHRWVTWLEKQKENPEEPKIAFGDWGDKEKQEAIFTCLKYMRFIKKITNQEYDDLTKWLNDNLVSNVLEKDGWTIANEQTDTIKEDYYGAFLRGEMRGYLRGTRQKEQKPLKVGENAYFDPNTEMWFIKKQQKEPTPAEPELKIPDWVHGGWDDEYMINTVIGRYSLHAEVAKKHGDTHDYNLSKSMENWLRNVVKPLILGKQKGQKELPLMNCDADLYFDEWNLQQQNPTKRQCFEEGIRYAKRLQKEPHYTKRNELFDKCVENCDPEVMKEVSDNVDKLLQKEQKPKQEPKWLYRLEFKDKSCGLWYNGKGEWCLESGIGSLDDSCKTKNLPMDYDERYKQDGRNWFSSCSKKEDLLHWYSKEDAKTLLNKGFVFTRYLATEYHEYDQQTVFIKETALYREEIDFFELMKEQKSAEWNEDKFPKDIEKDATQFCFDKGINITPHQAKKIATHYLMVGHNEGYVEGRKNAHIPARELGLPSSMDFKQEWSEEDEKILDGIINTLDRLGYAEFCKSSREEDIEEERFYYKEIQCLKKLKSLRPSWKPSEDEVRLINTSISFLKDFADKGYENAVECIDWLKSKLNGNTYK